MTDDFENLMREIGAPEPPKVQQCAFPPYVHGTMESTAETCWYIRKDLADAEIAKAWQCAKEWRTVAAWFALLTALFVTIVGWLR